jgi:hypothetical protein
MAIRRNIPAYRVLDELVLAGKAMLIATPRAAIHASDPVVVRPQAGQVAIITKILCMTYLLRDSSSSLAENAANTAILTLTPPTGGPSIIPFLKFARNDALHVNVATPEWRSAAPCAPVQWELEAPLLIPSGWTLTSTQGSTDMAGGCFACYGYVTDEQTARNLGFDVSRYQTSPRSAGVIGALVTATPTTLIAGRAGFCIRINDLFARQQQSSHAPDKTFTIRQVTNDRVIFRGCNNNPSDFAEWKLSPGIYLEEGEGIELVGSTGIRATVAIGYEYVPVDQVPSNHWWCYREPILPTPALPTTGTLSLFTTASTPLNLFYPKLGVTRQAPGKAFAHVVEGYAVSAQKSIQPQASTDQLFFALTTGASAGQINPAAASALSTTNQLISPILAVNGHDQCVFLAVDGLNVPCVKDTGVVRIDATGNGAIVTPASGTLHLAHFGVLVWGRTVGATGSPSSTAHFRGA